jgi:hypothetical protein
VKRANPANQINPAIPATRQFRPPGNMSQPSEAIKPGNMCQPGETIPAGGSDIILTKVSRLPPEVKHELDEALQAPKNHLFVSDSPIGLTFFAALPLVLLGLPAWFEFEVSGGSLYSWTVLGSPEYLLLYSAFLALAWGYLLLCGYTVLTLFRHGHALTSYGLLKIRGAEVQVIPFAQISSTRVSQVTTTDKHGQVFEHKAHSVTVNLEGDHPAEVIILPNYVAAKAFDERIGMFRARGAPLPVFDRRPVVALLPVLLVLALVGLVLSPVAAVMGVFQYRNHLQLESYLDSLFQGKTRTAETLTDKQSLLTGYLYNLPIGPYAPMVRFHLRQVLERVIPEHRARVLKDPFHRHEYTSLLREYSRYCRPETFALELALLDKPGDTGFQEWRTLVEGKGEVVEEKFQGVRE